MKTNIHFLIISRWILLRVINVSDKSCTENQNTHFITMYKVSMKQSYILDFIYNNGEDQISRTEWGDTLPEFGLYFYINDYLSYFSVLLITFRWILHRMSNISDKSCTENQNTLSVFSNFFPENRTVYEVMWKNIVERGRPHDNMAHAHCVLDTQGYKCTHTLKPICVKFGAEGGHIDVLTDC